MAIKTYSASKDGNTFLSPHFQVKEFRPYWNGKPDGDVVKIDEDLIERLELLSDCVNNKAIHVSDGYRTEAFDKYLTGKAGQHTTGRAADIYVNGISSETLAVLAEACGFRGVGIINSRAIHVDTRISDKVVCFRENGTKAGTETVTNSFLRQANWLHIIEIPQDKISSIEYVETRESVKTTAKKFPEVDFIINGGFWYPYSSSIFTYISNGIVRSDDTKHKYGLSVIGHKELSYGVKIAGEENFISGYPVLIKNGEIADNYKETPEIDGWKARMALGHTHLCTSVVICAVDASVGATLRGMRQIMSYLDCYSAINLDGGGSTSLYSKGKCLNKQTDQRSVNNVIMIRLLK